MGIEFCHPFAWGPSADLTTSQSGNGHRASSQYPNPGIHPHPINSPPPTSTSIVFPTYTKTPTVILTQDSAGLPWENNWLLTMAVPVGFPFTWPIQPFNGSKNLRMRAISSSMGLGFQISSLYPAFLFNLRTTNGFNRLAVDLTQPIFVTMDLFSALLEFNSGGTPVTMWDSSENYIPRGGSIPNILKPPLIHPITFMMNLMGANFTTPLCIAIDRSSGFIYVSDGNF